MGIVRESMVFYGSFYEAIKDLPAEEFKKCACAILGYGLDGKEPEGCGIEKTIFIMARPQIDKNNQRYANGMKAHQKGRGQTVSMSQNGNRTATEYIPNSPLVHTEVQANVNANDNDNVNDNANDNENEMPPHSVGVSKYGEYGNVFLSEDERKRLAKELGDELSQKAIEHLSRYMKRKPAYKSACHYEDLRGWVADAVCSSGRNSPALDKALKKSGRTVSDIFEEAKLEDFFEN